jgi:hypothetical protein
MGDACAIGAADVNECLNPADHDCTGVDNTGAFNAAAAAVAKCNNADGYFYCTCESEFFGLTPQIGIHGKHECRDIDECANGTHECAGPGSGCTNTNGGYTCTCSGGTTLQVAPTNSQGNGIICA